MSALIATTWFKILMVILLSPLILEAMVMFIKLINNLGILVGSGLSYVYQLV